MAFEPDGVRLVTLGEFRETLRGLAGDVAVKRLDDVTERGDDPDPAPDVLGSCFQRVSRVYKLGLVRVQGFAWRLQDKPDCK